MSEIDLAELKRLAQAVEPEYSSCASLVRFQEVANPAAVLALIERLDDVQRHAAFLEDWSQATTEVVCGERPKGVMVATTLDAVKALLERVSKLEAALRSITDESLAFDLDECRAAAAVALEAK